jgi:hypothetical protein
MRHAHSDAGPTGTAMKHPYLFVLFALAAALVVGSGGSAAPALGEKVQRWEYAELHVQRPVAPLRLAPGGAVANPPPAPAPALTLRWSTGDEEIQADSWEQLAEKLKAPASKKEPTPTVHKLRVLNRLGADGWEIAEHTGTDGTVGTATWVFKRRIP